MNEPDWDFTLCEYCYGTEALVRQSGLRVCRECAAVLRRDEPPPDTEAPAPDGQGEAT